MVTRVVNGKCGSASADPRHEWRFIKSPINTLHYITNGN